MPESYQPPLNWSEEHTRLFLDYGRYFVPDREEQFQMLCDLIPPAEGPFYVLDLCCGEGLLAAAVLDRHPQARVHGLDGSPEMLSRAARNLAGYADRFRSLQFSLQDTAWRQRTSLLHGLPQPPHAVLSSLAIHHLSGEEKALLYKDMYHLLAPGGALLIADLVAPPDPHWQAAAASQLDECVRRRSEAIDGNHLAYEFFLREHWNIFRYPDPEFDKPSSVSDHLKWLAEAGFSHPDVFWLKAGHAIYGGLRPAS